uniref:RXYLT1 C-terminal domain-containing protein n=1 Tax=Hucho hucho TaxID=62062 RepID=A0A4W5RM68_9TELE
MGILKKTGLDKECIITAREKQPWPKASSPSAWWKCYRIYEAYGLVPVVEDIVTPGGCSAQLPTDWKELPGFLEKNGMSQEERKKLLEWYSSFRLQMKDRFTEVLELPLNNK